MGVLFTFDIVAIHDGDVTSYSQTYMSILSNFYKRIVLFGKLDIVPEKSLQNESLSKTYHKFSYKLFGTYLEQGGQPKMMYCLGAFFFPKSPDYAKVLIIQIFVIECDLMQSQQYYLFCFTVV
eukprot:TRINITY_DN22585_c0_g1_i1.p5 TRINITY_DN22585_c0_g1~~TRINITY_DN22585_c0_g1_i1.p5  ORF type:complete len:123 (+),score=9.97 TRINITY_DN22585_c0_g1_i1:761-1129(+)